MRTLSHIIAFDESALFEQINHISVAVQIIDKKTVEINLEKIDIFRIVSW